jgi:translation initiation factor 2B subunit (eIF-2B alpha/beta/delta family)
MPYVTFNSPESTYAILDYLLERVRTNKKINRLQDPLFVSHYNKILGKQTHTELFRQINDKCGFGKRNKKRNFFTSHMLRKLFTTSLYKAKVDELPINWMLGHKINSITESYFKADIKHLKNYYIQAMDHLTIEKVKMRRIGSDEVKEIVKELDKKDEEIKNILQEQEKKDQILVTMKQNMEKMEKKNKERDELLDKIMIEKKVMEELDKI